MKGDKLYCTNCRKYFADTQELYDSRDGGKPLYTGKGMKKVHYEWSCPYCFYNTIINVNQTMIKEQDAIRNNKVRNKYRGSKLYLQFIKDWPELNRFYHDTTTRAESFI